MHRAVTVAVAASALFCIIMAGSAPSACADTIGAGLTFGIPHGLALTLELPRGYPLIAQVHAGTAIFFSSIGAKAIVYPPWWRIQPFAFIGGAGAQSGGGAGGWANGSG